MLTIHLNNLIFHAFHGLYQEEKLIGNDFEVNVEVTFTAKNKVSDLADTIDYVSLHDIIRKVMEIPTPLIETVVQEIAGQIKLFDDKITIVLVSIKKIGPVIANFKGTVGISYTKLC